MSLLALAVLNLALSIALLAGLAAVMAWPHRNRRSSPNLLTVEPARHLRRAA